MNQLKLITTCRLCGSAEISDILSLGELALSDFVDFFDPKSLKRFPIELVICPFCSLVQTKHSYPSEMLYNNHYGYRSGLNQTMKSELKDIVDKTLDKIEIEDGDLVMDIGSNDGTLLGNYPKNLFRVGIDPIEKFAEECQRQASLVITDFFAYESIRKHLDVRKKAKIITAISMFYDLEDPNKFISDAAQLLADNGLLVIQQNYLVGMLQQNAFDNIVHEHLEYYSLTSLNYLLNKQGLTIIDVETRKINGGSFRVFAQHKRGASKLISGRVKKMLKVEKTLLLNDIITYNNFHDRVLDIKSKLYRFIKNEKKKGKSIYLYGASTRGNTLLQFCKLDNQLITAAVERNPEKVGKIIASVGIPIISEEQARLERPDYMLVLPWFFKEEFLDREKDYLEGGGQLIFPLPELEIIGKSIRSDHYQHSFIDVSNL